MITISRGQLYIIIALVFASAVAAFSSPLSYEEQLVRIQANQILSPLDKSLLNEPIEIQATLLDYSDQKLLLQKAIIALGRYPEKSREYLVRYGSEPEFKEILSNYGELIIPPIWYFYDHKILTLTVRDKVHNTYESTKSTLKGLWGKISGHKTDTPATENTNPGNELTAEKRGWYAINFIKSEGHDFLGQFNVSNDGHQVNWNQTERILEGLTSFFAGGIRDLETKHDIGAEITTTDEFWAGLDVLSIALPVKFMKAGVLTKGAESSKAAIKSSEYMGKLAQGTEKSLDIVRSTRTYAPKLLSKLSAFKQLGKYGAYAATAYIVISHPILVNSLFRKIAEFFGWPVWLIQFLGWALIIRLLLYPLMPLINVVRNAINFLMFRPNTPRESAVS